jgi:hypothetical protein
MQAKNPGRSARRRSHLSTTENKSIPKNLFRERVRIRLKIEERKNEEEEHRILHNKLSI